MSGVEIIALVSIIVGGLTAIAGQVVAARTAERQIVLGSRRDREDELRAVLEHAGVKMTEAIVVLDALRLHLSDLDADKLAPMNEEMRQLWLNEDRISVRLGRAAPETQHYRRAIDRIDEVLITCADGLTDGFSTKDFEGINSARNAAYQAQRQFYDAASERIGPGEGGCGRWPPLVRGHADRYSSSRNSLRLRPAVRRMLPSVPVFTARLPCTGAGIASRIVGWRMMWWLPRMRLRYQPFRSSALMTLLAADRRKAVAHALTATLPRSTGGTGSPCSAITSR